MKTEPTIEQPEPAVRSSAWLADGIVIEAMRRWGGGFVKALSEAATRADSDNLRRIKTAWPEYWQQYSDMAKSANEGMKTMKNPNCDNDKCTRADGDVRVLPAGGDNNLILCYSCFMRELRFRRERNRTFAPDCYFHLPMWTDLEIYGAEVVT